MSDGTHGHGATLTFAPTTATASTTAIGNIISFSGPDQSRDSIDKSTMDSTNKWREFINGMLDAGEVTFDVNYDGAASGTANDLNTLATSGSVYEAKIVINDHTTAASRSNWKCNGFITALGHAIPFDDKITQSVTVKFTAAPTFTDNP